MFVELMLEIISDSLKDTTVIVHSIGQGTVQETDQDDSVITTDTYIGKAVD